MVSAFPEPFDSLVKAVHIQGYGYPGEAEGQAQGRRNGFAAQEADDQGDARREVHEHTACRNGDAFDAGRKEHHRNGRDDARRRQEQPLPALESPDSPHAVIFAEGDEQQGQGHHGKGFDEDRNLAFQADFLFQHAIRRPGQADEERQPGDDAVQAEGQDQAGSGNDDGQFLDRPQPFVEEESAKEDEDDRIDEIGQAGLEDEALCRGVNIGSPVQGNEDTGTGHVRPLPALLPDRFQIGQELFLQYQ